MPATLNSDIFGDLAKIETEQQRRAKEGLKVYLPAKQMPFHLSTANELLLSGGKRCLAGDTELYDPVAKKTMRVDAITGPFHVLAYDQKTGQTVPATASKPFMKGHGDLHVVTLSNGQQITTTLQHRVLTEQGWMTVQEARDCCASLVSVPTFEEGSHGEPVHHARPQLNNGRFLRAYEETESDTPQRADPRTTPSEDHCSCESVPHVREDEQQLYRSGTQPLSRSLGVSSFGQRTSSQGHLVAAAVKTGESFDVPQELLIPGSSDDCPFCCDCDDGQSHPSPAAAPVSVPSRSDVREHIQSHLRQDDPAFEAGCNRTYQESCPPSRMGCSCLLEDLGCESVSCCHGACLSQSHQTDQVSCQSQRQIDPRPRTNASIALHSSVFPCVLKNRARGISIEQTHLIGQGIIWDIEVPGWNCYIAAGVVHHNSGKTTGAAAEFASRVTGIPINGPHNRKIPLRWPASKPTDAQLYFVIGFDVDHIGQTLYHKLFSPGLFRVIKDKATAIWRTFNPADEYDLARYDESEPAGPLIPERLIEPKSWSWENKAANNFASVRLKNGATICAFPSSSKHPKQGDAVSGIWIDEDIQFARHLKEWQDRLTDRNGWFLWSVWPHAANLALCDLIDRADEVSGEVNPSIQHFQLIMSENPFIPLENKQLALGRMGSEEEIARRDRGDMLRDSYNMYDFYPGFHVAEPATREELTVKPFTTRDKLSQILSTGGRFPREWTRYMAIDPSHTRTGVVFGVVPPPEWEDFPLGDLLIIEDELCLEKFSADMLAKAIRDKVLGLNYEAFIMDQNMGRQTRVGTDRSVFQIYSEAFTKYKIASRQTKNTFIPGCNVPSARYAFVRRLLAANDNGSPTMLFVANKTQDLLQEFKTYRKKRTDNHGIETILDEPENPRKHDMMAGLEYLCAYVAPLFDAGMAYVEPSNYSSQCSAVLRRARKLLAKNKEKNQEYVHLGPGRAA